MDVLFFCRNILAKENPRYADFFPPDSHLWLRTASTDVLTDFFSEVVNRNKRASDDGPGFDIHEEEIFLKTCFVF